jgi:hypothetical protein
MNPTAESQLKKHKLPVNQQNTRQYIAGYAMISPSFLLTIWWLLPLKQLIKQAGFPDAANFIVYPMVFILPGLLRLLFWRKQPAFARGLQDIMILMVTIIPIALLGMGLKKSIIMAGSH